MLSLDYSQINHRQRGIVSSFVKFDSMYCTHPLRRILARQFSQTTILCKQRGNLGSILRSENIKYAQLLEVRF